MFVRHRLDIVYKTVQFLIHVTILNFNVFLCSSVLQSIPIMKNKIQYQSVTSVSKKAKFTYLEQEK